MLKYITLPHVSTYKRRWVRRIMIIVTLPQAFIHANYMMIVGAIRWWRAP
jgi:hypothetical protein